MTVRPESADSRMIGGFGMVLFSFFTVVSAYVTFVGF